MSTTCARSRFGGVRLGRRATDSAPDPVLRQDVRGISGRVGHYRIEMLRLIAQMSLGTGALAVIGGTIVIVGFLTLSAGALIAVQGYNQLAGIGVEALTGFVSAF